MAQMAETVQNVISIVQEKNEFIRRLLSENAAMEASLEDKERVLGQVEDSQKSNAQMEQEMNKLRSDLKVKQNGNRMLGALMRAFKDKLEQEMVRSNQLIQDQATEL